MTTPTTLPSPADPVLARAARAFESGDVDGAGVLCDEVLKSRKKDFDALRLRGVIALLRGDGHAALKDFAKCLAQRGDDTPTRFHAGRAEAMAGRFDTAIMHFEHALRRHRGDSKLSEWSAIVHEWAGRHARARRILEPFIEAGTLTAAMAEVYARIELHERRPESAAMIAGRWLEKSDLDAATRHRLGHLAGRALEKMGDHDRSFAAHDDANRAIARPFDAAGFSETIDGLIEAFSKERVAAMASHPRPGPRQVFIAGMPRSGTTLVEQILAAHPEVVGIGEYPGLAVIRASISGYPRGLSTLAPDALVRLAQRYGGRLDRNVREAGRVVNKHLDNWLHVGLASRLFPGARFIHCRREPRDTCLSCFMSDILPAAYPWISRLADIGLVFRLHERLMHHWRETLDLSILEVGYEDLVEDLTGGVARLLDFCGLPADERCVRFHESGRSVMTLSYDQVRQPIYRSSVGRYEKYRRHLEPLEAALRADTH